MSQYVYIYIDVLHTQATKNQRQRKKSGKPHGEGQLAAKISPILKYIRRNSERVNIERVANKWKKKLERKSYIFFLFWPAFKFNHRLFFVFFSSSCNSIIDWSSFPRRTWDTRPILSRYDSWPCVREETKETCYALPVRSNTAVNPVHPFEIYLSTVHEWMLKYKYLKRKTKKQKNKRE